ncbi:hypothetical protein [Nonomuraea sp. NPDC050786]|uniref:hypothetical protein n=1 Tax=Nonomuraea sp. NPDC050786 TaxID=3154840 RepID=UPI003404CB00
MKTFVRAGLVGLAAITLGAVTSGPVQADTCARNTACNTTLTFTVTAGALEITVPDSAALSHSAASGGYPYGQLGAITVNDARGSITPDWTVSVIASDFTTGAASSAETVSNADVYYCSGDATTAGNGLFVAGQTGCAAPPPPSGVTLDVTRTAFSHSGGTGVNSATWNPMVTVATAASNVAGDYTGTITHIVA